MAFTFYITIEGAKQGKFKGESMSARHKDAIAGLRFAYEVQSPRDVATGQASGKRQHKPITLVKEWGAATPQLFQALVTNEVLKSVLFEFVHTVEGAEEVYFTVKLTNAAIADIQYQTAETTPGVTHEVETVAFTFQKIELEHKPGKPTASDDWHA